LLNKLLSATGANIGGSTVSTVGPNTGPFSSPIPWRKTGLRYARNEILFDMVERLQAIVNK
jgi:AP-3 complex subunit mu